MNTFNNKHTSISWAERHEEEGAHTPHTHTTHTGTLHNAACKLDRTMQHANWNDHKLDRSSLHAALCSPLCVPTH